MFFEPFKGNQNTSVLFSIKDHVFFVLLVARFNMQTNKIYCYMIG